MTTAYASDKMDLTRKRKQMDTPTDIAADDEPMDEIPPSRTISWGMVNQVKTLRHPSDDDDSNDDDDDPERTITGTSQASDFSSFSEYSDDLEQSDNDDDNQETGGLGVTVRVLEKAEIEVLEKALIGNVAGVTALPELNCRAILRHCEWDAKDAIQSAFSANCEQIMKKLGLADASSMDNVADDDDDDPNTCKVCFDDEVAPEDKREFICGHMICKECFSSYVTIKVKDDGTCLITCASYHCEAPVDPTMVLAAIESDDIRDRYTKLLRADFVLNHKALRFCPGADCSNAVQQEGATFDKTVGSNPVMCTCKTLFCFDCGKPDHTPVSCPMTSAWLKRCEQDAATAGWIAVKTKDCPKCGSSVFKDGGCNSVNCRCGQEFCWICLQSHNNHSFGTGKSACNRWDDTKEIGLSQERKAMKRYLHYFERFDNHKRSLALEENLKESVEDKATKLAETFSKEEAQDLLRDAVANLHYARTVLSWTYCFGNYVKTSRQKDIFEGNQENLETKTEELSSFLEKDAKDTELEENATKYKQDLLNVSSYCKSRGEILIGHVKEGYQKGSWLFDDTSLSYTGMGMASAEDENEGYQPVEKKIECRNGHALSKAATEGGRSCDKCGACHPKDTVVHSCEPCNYHLCEFCFTESDPVFYGIATVSVESDDEDDEDD